jgi:serine protease AprX
VNLKTSRPENIHKYFVYSNMKKLSTILILLLMVLPCRSQIPVFKFLVEFKDKNGSPYSIDNPSGFLSERAIERRLRYAVPVSESDIPVNPAYVDSIQTPGVFLIYTSRWLNSAVIYTYDSLASSRPKQFPFVKSVKYIGRDITPGIGKRKALYDKFGSYILDYGLASTQIKIHHGDVYHAEGYLGQDMVIAVLDAGFYNVDSLRAFDSLRINGQILGTRDFVKPGNNVYRGHTHGMSVLSIMGGNLPGELVGTAPAASYWLIRTEDDASEQRIEEINWIAGAEFADSVGADIINTSLGYSEFDDPLQNYSYEDMDGNSTYVTRGADMAASKGILVVVSAGNSGNKPWLHITAPADGDSVLAVGAVDQSGIYAQFSSQGPSYDGRIKPDVAAVGLGTFVQNASGDVVPGAGTSFAAPVMSGLSACLWQKFRSLSNYEIIKALQQSSSLNPYPNNFIGWGIPNIPVAGYVITGNEPILQTQDISIMPNPVVSDIRISCPSGVEGNVRYDIFDLSGREMPVSGTITGTNITEFVIGSADILLSGIYILRLTAYNRIIVSKFIKE